MKLLIVVNVDWFFHSHRLPIALASLQRGDEVHVATTFTHSSYWEQLTRMGVVVHSLSIDRSGRNLFKYFANLASIYSLCCALKPDIVHLVTIQPVIIGGLAAKLAGVKRVVFAVSGLGHVFVDNTFLGRIRRVLVEQLYRFALSLRLRAVIFQNSQDKARLENLCSIPQSQSFLIPGSGVDLKHFDFKPPQESRPIVLMASRLLVTKGVREFVSAAKILKEHGVEAVFQLIGAPDSSNPAAISLNELNDWRDQGIVEFLGHRTDLNELMSCSHLVCLPSYYPEGLPKVLCEAAACGRAIITTNEPGCRDAIEDGVTGLLIPSKDPVALANAIEYLLLNPDLLLGMGLASRKRAEALFDVNNIVSKHLDIYDSLLMHSQ
jgi:glycosyltransferase involved in cell wall biosynthesis